MKKSILLISGMDFSGKSSVVNELVQAIPNSKKQEKLVAPVNNNEDWKKVLKIKKSSIWGTEWNKSQMDYFDSLMYRALQFDVEHYFETEKPVIQDSLLVIKRYAKLLHRNGDIQSINRYKKLIDLLPNAQSFYLVTEPAERLRRFQLRSNSGIEVTRTDKMLINCLDDFLQIDEIYKNLILEKYSNTQIIDTTSASPKEVADTILRGI